MIRDLEEPLPQRPRRGRPPSGEPHMERIAAYLRPDQLVALDAHIDHANTDKGIKEQTSRSRVVVEALIRAGIIKR